MDIEPCVSLRNDLEFSSVFILFSREKLKIEIMGTDE